jgi:hypothetical protein
MAPTSRSTAEAGDLLATVTHLVTAADGDTLYRDIYLRRAAELLAPVLSATDYDAALTRREHLNAVLAQARTAVGRQDWAKVRELATRAAQLRSALDDEQAALVVADAVYGAPPMVLDPLSPGIGGASARWSTAEEARLAVSAATAALAEADPGLRQLYGERARALDAIRVPGAVPATTQASAPRGNIEEQALRALENGDIAAVNALAEAMLGKVTSAAAAESAASARIRLIAPSALAQPFPDDCGARAKALGLEPAEGAPLSPELRSAVAQFLEEYALGASAAVYQRATDGVARLRVIAERVTIPPDVAAVFAETLALFALHVYVNSAGLRYVPLPVEREPVLIEAHAEGDDALTPLLRELRLDRRRGIARHEIEMRLHADGPRITADLLGLDPHVFRLVCLPPDLYVRLGRDRGWGRREEWTHFDGYQLVGARGLRALVGGNARYGGLADLCSISRDDARENTVVRLAVIRRERLGVRFGVGGSSAPAAPVAEARAGG